MMMTPTARRIHGSVLADREKQLLVWLANRTPAWINSDHLTALGALAMAGAGVCYAFAPLWRPALALAVLGLALNWLGDSLDGTLARVRRQERPRYGFYVDHVLDACGVLSIVAGITAGGFATPGIAGIFLIAYYLLTVEIGLATHALGTFRLSYWKLGPTELRILLALGTAVVWRSPLCTVAGRPMLLFDVGFGAGAAVLLLTFLVSAISNAVTLFRAEPRPDAAPPAAGG